MTGKNIAAHIWSTISTKVGYAEYGPAIAGGVPPLRRVVEITGGANVADKLMITPSVKGTPVTDDELAFLMANDGFQRDMRNGFIDIRRNRPDADSVADGMVARDKSAPLRNEDFEKAPTVKAA